MRLATLTIEEARLPLSEPDRAMIVRSLQDIVRYYEQGDVATLRACLHIINVPALPIHSNNCGKGA